MNKELVKNDTSPGVKMADFDINKIVKKAREHYSKTEKGLASQLATGSSLVRPHKDSDFIVWSKNNMWQSLTSLKGLPFGKVIQVAGRPDSGKSTLANLFMKQAQDQGYIVICWDSEKKFNKSRFQEKMGGDPDKLLVVDTNSIIDGAKAVAYFVHAIKEELPEAKILICWDSIGASLNSSETKEEDEDFSAQPGVSAKQNSWALKKFAKLANTYFNRLTGEETICTLLVNQNYATLGSKGYTESGGSQIYYLSSIVLQMSRKQDLTKVKGGDRYKYGIVSRVKVKKNHLFEGNESLAELDVVVASDGIHLANEVKSNTDIHGWDEKVEEDEEK